MTDLKPKAYKKALADLRKQYFNEIELSLRAAMVIRDTAPKERDRNDAIKTILKTLGALQPEKESSKSTPDTRDEPMPQDVLRADEEERIRKLIHGV